ncbi:DUF4386 domain-containing protein [Arthrobacter sp. B3I4]|uniref:DUF4386 domain-containing protein n=1 Tax=Arthrobacter sp. B3I4 TaxID=3042267 RepID=UPI00278ABF61|nr:DUF4386 domain-containing protein [Arthrobacter sp. B3I4]MDQ0756642.1 hypothetical protein [Arthrobacter sp. B3I4]
MNASKGLARIAGALYLAVAILSGFAIGIVRPTVYAAGDAAATTHNIAANEGLFRLGFLADLTQSACMLLVAMTLCLLFQHVNKNVARSIVVFAAVSAAIQCLNLAPYLAALSLATDPSYATAFGPNGADALVLLLLDLQHSGFLIAQVFFGLWLLPMGYLAFKSGMFPKVLGVMLIIACFTYLAHLPFVFLWPEAGNMLTPFVAIPATLAEAWMVLYLLIRGVKTPNQNSPVPAGV